MPGVVVNTAVRSGPATRTSVPSSTYFALGQAERGPSDVAKVVNSFEEFEAAYGGYVTYGYLHPTLQTFFEEGGSRAYIGRVVGASATTGFLNLAAVTGTSIVLTAAGPGDWSNDVEVTVTHPTASTFTISLFYQGSRVYTTGSKSTPAAAVDAINASPVASLYVVASLGGSTATAPDNNPVVIAEVALSAGDDDRDSIGYADYLSAMDSLFTADLGPGAISTPGLSLANTASDLIAHGVANNRIVVGSFSAGASFGTVTTEMADYEYLDNAEYLAMYWPWVKVSTDAGTLTIPPDGFVTAKRAIAHNTVGSWNPGAGSTAKASFVNGLETTISASTAQSLDDARINALRIVQNAVRVYGARSATENEADWRYITYRDFLNDLSYRCHSALEDLVFSSIDGRRSLFSRIEARLVAVLEPIRKAGGFYEAFDAEGNQIDAGYSVDVSDALNPVAQLSEGLIIARVGVRISGVGDRIELTITKSNLTSTIV